GLEDVQLVALDQVLPGEQRRGDTSLLDQAAQALGMNPQFPGCLDQVEVIIKGGVWHECVHPRSASMDQLLTRYSLNSGYVKRSASAPTHICEVALPMRTSRHAAGSSSLTVTVGRTTDERARRLRGFPARPEATRPRGSRSAPP